MRLPLATLATLATLAILLLLLPAARAHAAWPPEGKVVSDLTLVYGDDSWHGSGPCEILLDANGGPVVITSASGLSSFYWDVARLSANGDTLPGWPTEGRRLWGTLAGFDDRWHGVVIAPGGDLLYGFVQNSRPCVQRLSPAGVIAPPAAYWFATTSTAAVAGTDIASGPENTMFVAWATRLQRMRSDGSVCTGWPATGLASLGELGFRASVLPDGSGGAIVVSTSPGTDVRATRVDSNGVRHAGWPVGGRILRTGTEDVWDYFFIHKPLVQADATHFITGWTGSSSQARLRVQRFDLDGVVDPNWDPAGVLVCSNDSLTSITLVSDQRGGVWAGWERLNKPFVAHVLANGSVIGPGGFSPLDANAVYSTQTFRGVQPIGAIAMDAAPDGGLFFAWSDLRSYGFEQTRFRRLAFDGQPSPLEPDTGRVVWTVPADLVYHFNLGNTRAIRSDGQGGVYVLRDLGAPFALHHVIPFAAVGVPPAPPRSGLALRAPAPNPARDAITLRFTLPDRRPATLRLLDVAGREVRRAGVTGAGEHVIRWDDAAALPPGLYLAQLRQGAEQRTARVVVTR